MKTKSPQPVPVASTEKIIANLQDFFKTDQSRTTVGRLREMFDTIEKLRDGGMSLENIRLVLEKNNLKISLPTLTKSLQRIRAERGVKKLVSTPANPPAPAAPDLLAAAPAAPDLLGRSRRSGDLAPQEVGAVPQLTPDQQEAGEDDNPLIAMGIGTSLQKVASKPKKELTFNKRNQVG